jgi:PGF-CTERM protein
VGKTGNWYRWNGAMAEGVAFSVKEPSLKLKIWDATTNSDITGKAVPVGSFVNFRVETNMMQIPYRPGYTAADGAFTIKVKTQDGGVYTNLVGSNGAELALTKLTVDQQVWYWVGKGNDHTQYPSNDGWDTGAVDRYGNRVYKAGTYTAWVETNVNSVKDNYVAPDGSAYTGKTISATQSVTIATDQVRIEANKDTVVRGNSFTITITGVPNFEYYIWVKGSSSMTGLPEDQPPMVLTAQEKVSQDNPNGPYTIGQYAYEGGAGKIIKDDVPDDPDYHGAKYYAMATLSSSGVRTIEFQTSKATKDKKYTIRVERKSGNQYKSDEVDIVVEKGDVTVVASGDQSYYLGEEVKLSGTNSETESTYLFITGPNLPANGGQLKYPRTPTVDGQATTFDVADVQDDNTWELKWQTANLEIDAGAYTIYAVSAPWNRQSLSNAQYDTVSLVIKKPYVQSTASSSVVAKGDKFYLRGTAEGDPSNGVAIWIIGKNYVAYATATVNDDKTFEYEIKDGVTSSMYSGQYFVVVQHPMYNDKFDVYPDSGVNPQFVLGEYPARGSELFKIAGPGALQGSDAAEALINAINNAMIDDTYTKLQFLVEEAKVSINPIGQQIVGSKFEITGTTNLDYDGNDLLVEVTSSSFAPTSKDQSGAFSGATGTVPITQGTDGINKWAFTVDAATFKPDEYIVRVTGVTVGIVDTAVFTVVEAPAVAAVVPTIAPTEQPTEAPVVEEEPVVEVVEEIIVEEVVVPETTQTSPGFGALLALAGLGAVAFVACRKE